MKSISPTRVAGAAPNIKLWGLNQTCAAVALQILGKERKERVFI